MYCLVKYHIANQECYNKIHNKGYYTFWNSSSYTTLDVSFISSPSSLLINIFSPSPDLTLYTIMYSCPCENTGVGRNSPTCCNDWHWLLLMVMANQTAKGNYRLWNSKGIRISKGDRNKRGINNFSPTLLPDITSPSSTYFPILVMINLVPLHKPFCISKFSG